MAASDESNNLGSVEQVLEVPDLAESGMAASSLVLPEEVSKLPDLIRSLQSSLLDDTEPLIYSGMQVFPSADNKLRAGAALPVFFKLYGLGKSADRGKLTARARLISDKGIESLLSSIPLAESISPESKDECTVGISLLFQDAPPGRYTLVIEASDGVSPLALTLRTDLELVED